MTTKPQPLTREEVDRVYGTPHVGDMLVSRARVLATIDTLAQAHADHEASVADAKQQILALTAEVERLTRERDDKHADFVRGAKVAHALTQETQTAEDYATDLVRIAKKARAERDAAIARAEKAERERDEARGQVAALREALIDANHNAMAYFDQCRGCQSTARSSGAALANTAESARQHEERIRADERSVVMLDAGATFMAELQHAMKGDKNWLSVMLAAHDAAVAERARREAFRSCALELRASVVAACRDGDPVDVDLIEAGAETFDGYADGDGAPDDAQCRAILDEAKARLLAAKETPT